MTFTKEIQRISLRNIRKSQILILKHYIRLPATGVRQWQIPLGGGGWQVTCHRGVGGGGRLPATGVWHGVIPVRQDA